MSFSLYYQHILKQEGKKSKESNQQWAAFDSMPDSRGYNYQKCITDTAENFYLDLGSDRDSTLFYEHGDIFR